MSTTFCRDCKNELTLGVENYPTCAGCKSTYHFAGCSGLDESAWAKRPIDRRVNWVCHHCNPDKNMPRSKSGLNNPVGNQSSSAADPVLPSQQAENHDLTPAAKKRPIDMITSPDNAIPEFESIEAQCMYVMNQCLKTMASNTEVIQEFRELKADFVTAQKRHEADQARILELEKNSRADRDKIIDLEHKVRMLEDYSRVDNMILHGVPLTNNQYEAMNLVIKSAKIVGIEITYRDINACHSLRSNRSGPSRIVCRFNNRWLKNQAQAAINRAKITTSELGIPGECIRVFATDHLSPDTSKLYAETKNTLATKFGGSFEEVFCKN